MVNIMNVETGQKPTGFRIALPDSPSTVVVMTRRFSRSKIGTGLASTLVSDLGLA